MASVSLSDNMCENESRHEMRQFLQDISEFNYRCEAGVFAFPRQKRGPVHCTKKNNRLLEDAQPRAKKGNKKDHQNPKKGQKKQKQKRKAQNDKLWNLLGPWALLGLLPSQSAEQSDARLSGLWILQIAQNASCMIQIAQRSSSHFNESALVSATSTVLEW